MNRKSKILILLEQSRDYKLLSTLLERNYEIIKPEKFPDPTLNFDLIILDGITHNRYKKTLADEKSRANPLFLPVLILTGKKDVDIAATFLWKTVDEMIVMPVNKTELHARVEMLLRTRNQSIELDYSHNRLIKQNREQLNLAVKAANVGLWDWNLETNKVYFSPEWKKQIGYEANELSDDYTEWYSRVHPDDIERCMATIGEYLKNPWPDYTLEFRFRHKNGTYIWIYTQASLVFDDEGKPVRMLGSHVDVSEQKKSEENLQESEKKYRLLFESNPHPMWVYDTETLIFLEVNHAAIAKYGYSKYEFLNMTIKDIRPSEDIEILLENVRQKSDELSFSGEWRHKNRNGDIFIVEIISHSINYDGKNARLVLANDITERKQAENKLKLYTRAIEQSPVSLNITDSNGDIVYVNSGFTALSGYSPEEAIGKNPRFLKSGVHSNDFYKELWASIVAGKNWSGELCNKNKEGHLYWVQATISPVVDSKGKINHFVAIKEDITKKRQTEKDLIRSEKELKKAQQITHIGSWFLDVETNEVKWTEELYKMYGFDPLLPPPPYTEHMKLFTPMSWEILSTSLATTRETGIPYELELKTLRKDGSNGWMWVRGERDVDSTGKTIGLWGAAQDISERKKIEEELRNAKEKAEESDRLKSAFLANMSHEIRTPMNGILGFTELLLEPDLSSSQKEQYIAIVHKSGQRMLNTVTDIVEISKIEAGIVKIFQKETDINESVAELVRFFKPEAEKKGLQLILKELLPESAKKLVTDQNKLDSILTNLIKNAIKYTETGTIHIGCQLKDSVVEFYTKDTGIGISKHRHEAIFNRFEQADIEDTRVFEGSGLGLAIAKSYVEMLGGKIWVESIEGLGSTFHFTLPLVNNRVEKTVIMKEVHADKNHYKDLSIKRALKILIAEDDEPSRNYISILVKDFCSELLETKTGIETVELCRKNNDIDLILLDIQMPGINGYEATRRIREFNKEVVIIVQTAFALSGDKEKALNAGCNDFITKPIAKEKLIKLVESYFNS